MDYTLRLIIRNIENYLTEIYFNNEYSREVMLINPLILLWRDYRFYIVYKLRRTCKSARNMPQTLYTYQQWLTYRKLKHSGFLRDATTPVNITADYLFAWPKRYDHSLQCGTHGYINIREILNINHPLHSVISCKYCKYVFFGHYTQTVHERFNALHDLDKLLERMNLLRAIRKHCCRRKCGKYPYKLPLDIAVKKTAPTTGKFVVVV